MYRAARGRHRDCPRTRPPHHSPGKPWRGVPQFGPHRRARVRVEVAEDRAAPGLGVQVEPLPSAVADEAVAGQVGGRSDDLLARGGGVQLQCLVGASAELLSHGLLVILRRRLFAPEQGEPGHLLGVPTDQQRDVRLTARGVNQGGVFGEEVAVNGDGETPQGLFRRLLELFGRQRAERGQRVSADGGRELDALGFGLCERDGAHRREYRPALADSPGDQVLRHRRRHLRADRGRACRLAGDGHAPGVSAEGRDVLLHPAQRRGLIEQPVVARCVVRRLLRQFRVGEEAEDAEAVVNGDGHDAAAGHALAVVARLGAVPGHEPAAVKIDEHRQPLSARRGGRPDVEVEAVFAHPVGAEAHVAEDGVLHAARAELDGLAHARPALDGLRRLPTLVARGRLREGDALKDADA